MKCYLPLLSFQTLLYRPVGADKSVFELVLRLRLPDSVLTVAQFLVVFTVSSPQQPRNGTDGRCVAAVAEPVLDEP